jgi:thiol-disulfide isomerase/thioredoxin
MYKRISYLLFASLCLSFFACENSSTATQIHDPKSAAEIDASTLDSAEFVNAPESSGPKQTLTSKEGRKVAVYDYDAFAIDYLQKKDDYTYVLNFWATWCGPCVAELPHFLELEKEMKDKKVKFIFVSFDDLKKLETKLLPFLDERKIDSEIVVLDQKGINEWLGNIDKDWSGSIPATLVYKANERRFYEQKFDTKAELITTLAIE